MLGHSRVTLAPRRLEEYLSICHPQEGPAHRQDGRERGASPHPRCEPSEPRTQLNSFEAGPAGQVRGVRGSWSRCKRARDSCRMAGVLRGSRGREEEGELRDEYSLDEGIERSDAPRDAPS
jgi:hypothetical protein